MVRCDFRIHRRLPLRSPIVFGLPRVLRATDPPGLSPPLDGFPRGVDFLLRGRVTARVVALRRLHFVSSIEASCCERFDDDETIVRAAGDSFAESISRNSFSALRHNCGLPSDIDAHIEASHIQEGSSRDIPVGTSTWTTAAAPRPARRNKGKRCPCSGCQRYSISTDWDRYAECRLILATTDEHVQRLRRERILLHHLSHQRSQSVPAGPHVDRRPVQVHLHIPHGAHHAASPDINADIQDGAGKLAHSIVQPDGWRIRHTVVVVAAATAAAAGAMRTATNPAGLAFSARRRPPITPLRINTRLTQLHS